MTNISPLKTNRLKTNRRFILWTIIALFFIYDLFQSPSLFVVGRHTGADFMGYWASGRIYLNGGNPYDANSILPVERAMGWPDPEPLIMWSPPWTYILFFPFLLLPFNLGRIVWFFFNLLLLTCSADFFWRLNGGEQRRRWISWLAVLLFIPSAIPLNTGQISPMLLAGTAGFLHMALMKRDFAAGLFLLPLTTKPQVLYLFLFFVIIWTWKERRWKIFLGIGASFVICVLLSLFLNPSIYGFYLNGMQSSYGPFIWETPTFATLLRILIPGHERLLLYLLPLSGAIIGLAVWFHWRKKFNWQRYLIPVLLISVLTAPYVWTLDLVVLLPLALVIVIRFQECPNRQMPWFIALVAAQVIMCIQLFTAPSYFYLIWVAPTLALLYWFSTRSLEPELS